MRRLKLLGVIGALAIPAMASTVVCTTPGLEGGSGGFTGTAEVTVAGTPVSLQQCVAHNGGLFSLTATFSTDKGSGSVIAHFDSDPFITFGATTTNSISGAVTYAFLFGTPIAPSNYNTATSSGGVSVAPGAANNTTVTTSAIAPTYITGFGTLGAAATDLNVGNGTATCAATVQNNTCNFPLVTGGAPGFYDNLEALLTYTQTDLASVASWSGRVDLFVGPTSTTPEPATTAMMGAGAVLIAAMRLRRRS